MPEFRNGFALLIAIANYPKVQKLPEIVLKDACDLRDLLKSPIHCGYMEQHVRVLVDEQASSNHIIDGISWLASSTDTGDTAILFFSGHGGRLDKNGKKINYLLPYDCDPINWNNTTISGDILAKLISNIRAKRLLVVFDCCFSGGLIKKSVDVGQKQFKSGLGDDYYKMLASGSGRVVMASSRSDEVSLALPDMVNSLFTHYFLKALLGNVQSRGDRLVRIFDIFDYVSTNVSLHANQHPVFHASDVENNFPIAINSLELRKLNSVGLSSLEESDLDKQAVRQILIQKFNIEELRILCSEIMLEMSKDNIELLVDLEMVGGIGKEGIALNLIDYLDRRGYLEYLLKVITRMRPRIVL